MPNWKKLVTSGSNAALSSLFVSNAVTASIVSASTVIGTTGRFNNLQVSGSTVMSGSGVLLQLIGSGSTIFSISGSGGEIFKIADDANNTSLFTVSSASINLLDIDSSKNVRISGSLIVTGSITGSLFGTASWAYSSSQALTASYVTGSIFTNTNPALSASYALSSSYSVSSSYALSSSYSVSASYALSSSYSVSSSYAVSSSYSLSSSFATTSSYALTASYVNPLKQIVEITGSLYTTGSNIFIGTQTVTGSLFTTGSNTLVGNTILSGTLQVQGEYPPEAGSASVSVVGNVDLNGFLRFDPVTSNIDTTISASYIYVSGSTNDLYFSQNGAGYTNTTRLHISAWDKTLDV